MKPTNLKIVFFGSSKYSVLDAQALHKAYKLIAIVTNRDKPKGRKRELAPTPPKQFAQENKIRVLEADKLDKNFLEGIENLHPDFIVVADYGLILPDELLKIPKFAPLNVHHSLLPKYRGPTPAPAAILAGEKTTGVTIIQMTASVDAGPIYAQEEYEMKPDETTDSLLLTLNRIGGQLVAKVIKEILAGAKPTKQDEEKASYTHRFKKVDGHINLLNPPNPQKLNRMVRAFYPWPIVWFELDGKRIKLLPENKIQMEGKRPLSIREFKNGYPDLREKIENLLNRD